MARRRQRLIVPIKFDEWIEGLDNFDPGDEILHEWTDATERFYASSQEHVHVITNALRTSGRHDTERDGRGRVVGTLTYGGTSVNVSGSDHPRLVDYAVYEQRRGGDHDWITKAFAESREGFSRALEAGIDAKVRSFI